MKLTAVEVGAEVEILEIPDLEVRAQAIRFGISKGSRVQCWQKISKGPMILKKNLQHLALGYGLAQQIEVRLLNRRNNFNGD